MHSTQKATNRLQTACITSQVIAGDVTTKALGVQWETDDDSFVFNPSAIIRQANELKKAPTKRDILKISARIFDPLGLISAVVLQLTILFQRLREEPVGWDATAPDTVSVPWFAAIREL